MSEKGKIARAAGIVGISTLLSRILGLVRDLVTAYFFGAGLAADAFFVAFRLPNLLRRLLAEGALTVSFIPVFTEYLETKSRKQAFLMARSFLSVFIIVLAGVTILGEIFAPQVVRVFAPGFYADPEKFELTVFLTRIVFPYIFLVGLVTYATGVLNSLGRFAAPALAPVMLNLGMILCVFFLAGRTNPPILALAIGVILGGALQVLLQIPYLAREGGLLGLAFNFKHPAISRIGLLMAPAAVGAAVYQVSVFISTILASLLPQGSVSYLYYADRVVQFPLGIFAIAIGTAVLPSMSRQAVARDMDGLAQTLTYSLRLVFFITIPALIGLMVLAEPIVKLLFQHGRFTAGDAQAAAQALVAYCCGLWALSGVQIMVRVFYALQDTRTPVKAAVVSLTFNIVLAVILMWPYKHVGLALASAAGSILNFFLLVIILRRRLSGLSLKSIALGLLKNMVWAGVMGAVVFVFMFYFTNWRYSSGPVLVLEVGAAILLGVVVYAGLALAGRAPEATSLLDRFRTNA